MSAKQVINRIVSTAKDAGAPGKDPLYGFGVLNAEAALKDNVPETAAIRWGPSRTGSASTAAETSPRPRRFRRPKAPSAAPTLPEATVPVAEPPSQLDSALPAAVVHWFRRPLPGHHRGRRHPAAPGVRDPGGPGRSRTPVSLDTVDRGRVRPS